MKKTTKVEREKIFYDWRTIGIKMREIEDFRKKPQKDLSKAVAKVNEMYAEVLPLMKKLNGYIEKLSGETDETDEIKDILRGK